MRENASLKENVLRALEKLIKYKELPIDEYEALIIAKEADPRKIRPLFNDKKTIRRLIALKQKIRNGGLCMQILRILKETFDKVLENPSEPFSADPFS